MDFKKLVVIDASTVLAGPSVGMFFAELGATVIKIEHPKFGDVTCSWKLSSEDKESKVSAYFSSVNYRKKYVQLDYTNSGDYQQFLNYIERADILLSNFKFGDVAKFQLEDALLFERNPTLIHGKITGFGENSDRVAYDLIVQAESGFMSMNGTPESGPVKMPVALIDVLTAHQLKEGLLLALLKRQSTGKGSVVSASLYETAVCSLINQSSNYLNAKHIPQRIGSLHPNIAPYGELFQTRDKHQITFAIGSDKHFEKLCNYLSCENLLADKRFKSNQMRVQNRVVLAQIIQEKIAQINGDEMLQSMLKMHVPAGKIKSLDEVLESSEAQKWILEENIDGVETKRIKSIAFHLK